MSLRRRTLMQAAAATLAAPSISRAQSGSTLKFVPYADLAVLDPILTTNYVTRVHATAVFDTLYGLDEKLVTRPQMAQGHITEDEGKTWKITLREGLKFHDGAPVLARDVVASLIRWSKRDAFGGALFAATDEISAPSDRVIQFRLKRPFPLLPEALGKPTSYYPAIMPERLASLPATTQVKEMIGSGAYRFIAEERVPGALAVYRKFEGYVPRPEPASFTTGGKIAHFDRIEWHTIADAGTAAAALQAGEVDWWEQPNIDLLPLLRKSGKIKIEVVETAGLIGQIRFNHLVAPFDNPAFCRALLGAVDQREMMTAVAGNEPGIWRDRVGIYTPGTPSASEAGMEILTSKRDLAAVKKQIEASGYKGEKIVLLAGTDVPRISAICQVMADVCQKLGLNLDYVATDWGTVIQRILSQKPVAEGGWSMHGIFSGGLDLASPAYHLAARGNGKAGVPSWLTDPKLEELHDAWFVAPDPATQAKIAAQMQEEALAVGAYVPCGLYYQPTAYRSDLSGMLKGLPQFTGLRRG